MSILEGNLAERAFLLYAIENIERLGWRLAAVDDGEDLYRIPLGADPLRILDVSSGTDEVWWLLKHRTIEGVSFRIFLVWNSGPYDELINNWALSNPSGLDQAMRQELFRRAEGTIRTLETEFRTSSNHLPRLARLAPPTQTELQVINLHGA